MSKKDIIANLKIISYAHLALLIIGTGFIAFNFYIVGIPIIAIGFFIEWKFYRCPHCNHSLDSRMKLRSDTHCPECGKILCKTY